MPRARWWVIGALSVVTLTVVLLDVTGVIFEDAEPAPPPPIALPTPLEGGAPPPRAVAASGAPDPNVIRRVERILSSDTLGRSMHAIVTPLADPDTAWTERRSDEAAAPASTLKLWTAAATLDAYDANDRLSTSVLWDAATSTLVLVGGGDATLETDPSDASGFASLTDLARMTARELRRAGDASGQVTVDFDDSLFTGPAASPDWEPTYVTSGVIAPVTALMVDQGKVDPPSLTRYPDPASAAASAFADLLHDAGVDVAERHRAVTAPEDLPSAEAVASVESPPINDLVEDMLRNSDNQLAEALGRLSAEREGLPASFTGASKALRQAATSRGVDLDKAEIVDASGLSRTDRLTATALVQALHFGADEPDLAPILSGLAVAGFDGTLADRFSTEATTSGAGVVRAKTGTLTGISAEAGVTTTCDGELVSYAFLADAVPDTEAARSTLDEAAAALAACP